MSGVTITLHTLEGLLALHRYRLLSVDQFARASGLKASHVRDVLRTFERKSLLASIGNVGLRGGSKAPKLYHLTQTGYAAMLDAGGLTPDDVGPFKRAHQGSRWSPIMAHRMATIDLLLSVEESVQLRTGYRVVRTFHEYRRTPRGKGGDQPETSDYVADPERPENRVVPDGAFILEKTDNGSRALYFVEADRGTERLTRGGEGAYSIIDKFRLYERYLRGGRFAAKYSDFGSFRFFTLLFVTTTADRIANARQAAASLDGELHPYFKLATLAEASADMCAPIWASRDGADHNAYSIVKKPERGEQQ
ncbi:MAG: replication-relaxation family protein [Gammaproteobacteria bacterium]